MRKRNASRRPGPLLASLVWEGQDRRRKVIEFLRKRLRGQWRSERQHRAISHLTFAGHPPAILSMSALACPQQCSS